MHIILLVPVSSRLHGLSGYVLVHTLSDLLFDAPSRVIGQRKVNITNYLPIITNIISISRMAAGKRARLEPGHFALVKCL